MRVKFLVLFAILLCISGCGKENEYPEITTPAATTKNPDSTPVQPTNIAAESLPAIIGNLESGLLADYEEYKKFKAILDNVNEENAVELIAKCDNLINELSETEEIINNLTETESSAVTSLGIDIDGYNALYENYKFLRNTKIDVLTAIKQHLEDIENMRENLDTIINFYQGYTTFFQVSMYYTVNSILNDCKVENDSINDFKDNVYPVLIEPFADSMKWETNNQTIDDIFQKLYADVEELVTDFSENSGLIDNEEEI